MKQEENVGILPGAELAPRRVAARVLGVTEFSERAKSFLKSQIPAQSAAQGGAEFTYASGESPYFPEREASPRNDGPREIYHILA